MPPKPSCWCGTSFDWPIMGTIRIIRVGGHTVDHWSPWLDLRILILTLIKRLSEKGYGYRRKSMSESNLRRLDAGLT